MLWETAAIAACMTLGVVLARVAMSTTGRRPLAPGMVGVVFLGSGVIVWASGSGRSRPIEERDIANRPIQVSHDNFATSDSCRTCHPQQYETWKASYHRTMTQVATAETIVGDFDHLPPWLRGRFERRGDAHFVIYGGSKPGEPVEKKPIVMTTGSHHYQIYWVPAGQGRRLQLVPALYHIEEQRWLPRNTVFLSHPGWAPATLAGEWNANCIKCHTTYGRPRVDDPFKPTHEVQLHSDVAEFGISCEACHGPAAEHVRANPSPVRRYREHFSDAPDATVVHPGRLSHERSAEVCGQCHAIFEFPDDESTLDYNDNGYRYRAGDVLADTRFVIRGTAPRDDPAMQELVARFPNFFRESYWSDGMVRVSGREYNGLLETPCFQKG